VGVVWDHRDGGKVNSLRDGLVMLRRAAAMRLARPGTQPARAVPVVVVEPPLIGGTERRMPAAPVVVAASAPSPQEAGEEGDQAP
jgi:hypothetical protein